MVGLGVLPGGSFSEAVGVSADGSVIAGISGSPRGNQAFRWTAATGMVGLGALPGGQFFSAASGISADGSVVVGASRSAQGIEAFRWTAATGMVGLGALPGGGFFSYGRAVSADGSVIVGDSITNLGSEAFIWDSGGGIRNLRGLLIGLGDDLTDWQLVDARGVSADGRTIVGLAENISGHQEAYVARLGPNGAVPAPTSCLLAALGAISLAGYAWGQRR
jgi:probable HAF family extracellular repeat protein